MKKKKINPICVETLKRADGFYRRAVKERRFRAKKGAQINLIAAIYNLMAIEVINEYEDLTYRILMAKK